MLYDREQKDISDLGFQQLPKPRNSQEEALVESYNIRQRRENAKFRWNIATHYGIISTKSTLPALGVAFFTHFLAEDAPLSQYDKTFINFFAFVVTATVLGIIFEHQGKSTIQEIRQAADETRDEDLNNATVTIIQTRQEDILE